MIQEKIMNKSMLCQADAIERFYNQPLAGNLYVAILNHLLENNTLNFKKYSPFHDIPVYGRIYHEAKISMEGKKQKIIKYYVCIVKLYTVFY